MLILAVVFVAGMICEAVLHPVSKCVVWIQETSRKN